MLCVAIAVAIAVEPAANAQQNHKEDAPNTPAVRLPYVRRAWLVAILMT